MYCPKCGNENFEGADLCLHCSWVLSGISTTQDRPEAKTSGLAITALVLAILSLFTFGLLILPALIFAIIALVKIEKSGGQLKGKGFAIVGLISPAIIFPMAMVLTPITFAIFSHPWTKTREMAQEISCETNLQGLACAMIIYANDYDEKYPTSSQWCDLLVKYADVNESQFKCAGAGEGPCNFAVNENIKELGLAAPADMVLLFESKPGWNQTGGPELLTTDNHCGEGCWILFNDGHAEFVRSEDLNNLLWTVEEKK